MRCRTTCRCTWRTQAITDIANTHLLVPVTHTPAGAGCAVGRHAAAPGARHAGPHGGLRAAQEEARTGALGGMGAHDRLIQAWAGLCPGKRDGPFDCLSASGCGHAFEPCGVHVQLCSPFLVSPVRLSVRLPPPSVIPHHPCPRCSARCTGRRTWRSGPRWPSCRWGWDEGNDC